MSMRLNPIPRKRKGHERVNYLGVTANLLYLHLKAVNIHAYFTDNELKLIETYQLKMKQEVISKSIQCV